MTYAERLEALSNLVSNHRRDFNREIKFNPERVIGIDSTGALNVNAFGLATIYLPFQMQGLIFVPGYNTDSTNYFEARYYDKDARFYYHNTHAFKHFFNLSNEEYNYVSTPAFDCPDKEQHKQSLRLAVLAFLARNNLNLNHAAQGLSLAEKAIEHAKAEDLRMQQADDYYFSTGQARAAQDRLIKLRLIRDELGVVVKKESIA